MTNSINHSTGMNPVETATAAAASTPPASAVPPTPRWPTPPFACYPKPIVPPRGSACELVALDGGRRVGELIFFVPNLQSVHLNLQPARKPMQLRFDQFQSLTLLAPLEPLIPPAEDSPDTMPAELLDLQTQRPVSEYRIALRNGGSLVGETVGHVETEHGLFLFLPHGIQGAVLRMFMPRAAFASFEVGPRLGDVLIEQMVVTEEVVEAAVKQQQEMRSRKLGNILVSQQVVTTEDLLSAIEKQATMPSVRLGEALLSLGLVTPEQIEEALEQQRLDRSVPLGELLVRSGAITRRDLQTALARKMGYPLVDLANFPCEIEALRALSFPIAQRLQALPLVVRAGRLVVGLEDPTQRATIDEIEFATQLKVVPVLASIGKVESALKAAYERSGLRAGGMGDDGAPNSGFVPDDTDKLMASLERDMVEVAVADSERQIEQSDNSLVRLINTLIIDASAQGVSDIHIECAPGREKIKVRFRKDGIMFLHLELPHTYRSALVARIKIMCDLDIAERRKPQDGKINFSRFSAKHKLELRVATIPTNNSMEDIVMRILASAKPLPMVQLGLSPRNKAWIEQAAERPYGLILCVGPTGSGKTTTLHSVLSYINKPERKIWTAEDPVEITQAGLRQVQVNPKIDWTFARALRAFLRADPDVIMVGEIRDAETAGMAIEASLTGHLVMSTLHTNSAPETVTRLLDMGMDPFNFADSLLMVLAQRLVRRLCSSCRGSRPATEKEINELLADFTHGSPADSPLFDRQAILDEWHERFAQDGKLMSYRSVGCEKCGNSGLRGRAGLHELMSMSTELREQIQTGSRASALQHTALLAGMRTLRQDGIEKVLQGVTTIEEVRATSNA